MEIYPWWFVASLHSHDQYFDVSKVEFMRVTAFTITRRSRVVYCRMSDDPSLHMKYVAFFLSLVCVYWNVLYKHGDALKSVVLFDSGISFTNKLFTCMFFLRRKIFKLTVKTACAASLVLFHVIRGKAIAIIRVWI